MTEKPTATTNPIIPNTNYDIVFCENEVALDWEIFTTEDEKIDFRGDFGKVYKQFPKFGIPTIRIFDYADAGVNEACNILYASIAEFVESVETNQDGSYDFGKTEPLEGTFQLLRNPIKLLFHFYQNYMERLGGKCKERPALTNDAFVLFLFELGVLKVDYDKLKEILAKVKENTQQKE